MDANQHAQQQESDTLELDISLEFKKQSAFNLQVALQIPLDGITAVFGKSGSGKTTLLRSIAGLEPRTKGSIKHANQHWLNHTEHRAVEERNIGLVFQEGALFENLNVQKNLAFAIKRAPQKKSLITFESVCSILALEHLLDRKTSTLSGGERQRVAIARALLSQPQLMLMDEPLASLDAQHKVALLPYLEKLAKHYNIPMLYVSHSLDEVIRLAKRLIILENGKVAAFGLTHEILSKPEYIHLQGENASSLLLASVESRIEKWNMVRLSLNNNTQSHEACYLELADNEEEIGQEVRVRVLAKDVSIALDNNKNSSILNRLPATIISIFDDTHSAMRIAQLDINGQYILARITRQSEANLHLKTGDNVWAQIKSVALIH